MFLSKELQKQVRLTLEDKQRQMAFFKDKSFEQEKIKNDAVKEKD